jgi:hypothetical protein
MGADGETKIDGDVEPVLVVLSADERPRADPLVSVGSSSRCRPTEQRSAAAQAVSEGGVPTSGAGGAHGLAEGLG